MIKLVAAKVRRLFSSLVLVFVFSTFFCLEKHHFIVVFSSLFTCCFKMKSLGVVALTCLSFSSIYAHKNTEKASGGCGEARRRGGESERAGRAAEKCRGDSVSQRYEIITRVVSL